MSGWGYELTMLTPELPEPPEWAFGLLATLARMTWDDGRTHETGDRIDFLEPIDGADSSLEAYAVALDPVVTPTDFPHGRYAFHRLVGITPAP